MTGECPLSVSHVDLSGLIFVVLALAWVGYLVPRALRHHDHLQANRPVEEFSSSMRVLERTPATAPSARPSPAPVVESPVSPQVRRKAAQRRRRVLLGLLVVTAVVVGVAVYGLLPYWSISVPVVFVFAWLVACRAAVRPRAQAAVVPVAEAAPITTEVAEEIVTDDDTEDSLWDPLPLTLPTYVTKPAARRTIRTIDLTTPPATAPAPETPAVAAASASASVAVTEAAAATVESEVRRAV